MKSLLTLLLSVGLVSYVHAQTYPSTEGPVSFFSAAPLEDIEAVSKKITSLVDVEKSEMAFLIPISSFEFEKKLMQEHFNENYLESEKYPNAIFKGKLNGYDASASGVQKVKAVGEMTIHGVKQDIDVDGTLEMKGKQMILNAKFPIKVADYEIEIPKVVFYNIAEVVEVTLNLTYEKQ